MKTRIAALVGGLRAAGVSISVAEAMDAARAAAVAGVEREVLREALAAALVKDEADRPDFLVAFARVFPARATDVPATTGGKRRRRAAAMGGAGDGSPSGGASAEGAAGARRGPADDDEARGSGRDESAGRDERREGRVDEQGDARRPGARGDESRADEQGDARRPAAEHDERGTDGRADVDSPADAKADTDGAAVDRLPGLRDRHLAQLPFRAMTPADVEACAPLVAAIAARVTARLRRRLMPRRTGRLDFRRTIRAAVPRGGIPFQRRYRERRPGRPDLVALCDVSVSAAVATEFFLALLVPAAAYFRRVRLFGFVDRLVEIEFVAGQVRPAAPIDLMARSDFGRVLRDLDDQPELLGTDTVLLVLGDARNNRRPPRADLLAAARGRVRRLVWLNSEPRARWDTGDSVIGAYARYADVVEACGTLAELERALAAVAKL